MAAQPGLRVSVLSVTPVKGLAVQHPPFVEVSTDGVEGDRALFLIDQNGELISCTELGGLIAHRADFDPRSGVLQVHGPDGQTRSDTGRAG